MPPRKPAARAEKTSPSPKAPDPEAETAQEAQPAAAAPAPKPADEESTEANDAPVDGERPIKDPAVIQRLTELTAPGDATHLRITSRPVQFRREGFVFTRAPRDIARTELTPAQAVRLIEEPQLSVEFVRLDDED